MLFRPSSRTALIPILLAAALMLVACRGGEDGDIVEPRFPQTPDPDAFARYLNAAPGVPRDGVAPGDIDNVADFPEAYYNTIDPDNTRDNFFKWRLANGFINADGSAAACDPTSCIQTHVRFRDTKDLGYGRNMFMRRNTVTGDIAVYVENFQVDAVPGVPYGPLNFEALVADDRQWNFGVNAIEFSAFPYTDAGARKFTKFYNFAGDGKRATGVSGSLQHFVDLDNRGEKAMPGACIVCHGGRARTLVVENAAGEKVLAPTLVGGVAGDVQAHLQTIEVNTLQFADAPGFRREDNLDGLRLINDAVLASYAYRDSEFTGQGDWDPTLAIETLRGRHDGDPGNPDNAYDAGFVPSGWQTDQNLYRRLMAPNCLVCHALQGTRATNTAALATLSDVRVQAQRIDHLVFERARMPAGLLNYSDFWDRSDKDPATLATALGLDDRLDEQQKAIRPGAPVARIAAPIIAAGIDDDGTALPIDITGSGSAFALADTHRWQVSPDDTASVSAAGPVGDAQLRVSAPGSYTLTLTVNGVNGGQDSTSQLVQVVAVDAPDAPPASGSITFFGDEGIQQRILSGCLDCHDVGGLSSMPLHFSACRSESFNGNDFLYRSVLARVNFDAPLDSLFLRKPVNGATDPQNLTESVIAGYHAGGKLLSDDEYSLVLSWILDGAPSGPIPAASDVPVTALDCTP